MDHKVTGDRCYSHVTTVGHEMTKRQLLDEYKQTNGAASQSQGERLCMCIYIHSTYMHKWQKKSTLKKKFFFTYSVSVLSGTQPFRRSVCSAIFLWSLITMAMTQLRIIFYMGAMNKMLEFLVTHGDPNGEHPIQFYFMCLICTLEFESVMTSTDVEQLL